MMAKLIAMGEVEEAPPDTKAKFFCNAYEDEIEGAIKDMKQNLRHEKRSEAILVLFMHGGYFYTPKDDLEFRK